MDTVIIRTEKLEDHDKVHALLVDAFEQREDEARLVERIRLSEGFIPSLSIVAEYDQDIVGHLLISRAKIMNGTEAHEVLALAPVAVHTDMQKQGIGAALIKEGLERSRALGYDLVLLIGHPTYYPRYGFNPARQFGIDLKQYEVPDEVFMVYELASGALGKIHGELIYPAPFFE